MKHQITIAQVLHLAADKYLYDGYGRLGSNLYSCCAIQRALEDCRVRGELTITERKALERRLFKGLRNMGLVPSSASQFKEFAWSSKSSQGARYAWLKFAAMIAEEQGV